MLRFAFVLFATFIGSAAFAQEPQRFAGEWRSASSGHHGALRARITPAADGYSMVAVGTFAKIIPFAYRTHLKVTGETPDGPLLFAEKKLPGFGTFRTSSVLTTNGFHAEYSAMKDFGTITLTRRH